MNNSVMAVLGRHAFRAFLVVLLITALMTISGGMALAQTTDLTFTPPSGTANGQKVYLSQSCHDRGGPSCNTNIGCNGYDENFWSASWATKSVTTLPPAGAGLLDRGYTVRIGRGTVSQNVSRSNSWGATMHVPLHSNAKTTFDCPNNSPSYGGTWVLYRHSNDQSFSNVMRGALAISPGSNDKIEYRDDLAELNTNAPTAYMETEFHTWTHGTVFLGDPWQHSWLIALGIDQCRGYPRAPSGNPTRAKACNW